jgi:hypothetical protein
MRRGSEGTRVWKAWFSHYCWKWSSKPLYSFPTRDPHTTAIAQALLRVSCGILCETRQIAASSILCSMPVRSEELEGGVSTYSFRSAHLSVHGAVNLGDVDVLPVFELLRELHPLHKSGGKSYIGGHEGKERRRDRSKERGESREMDTGVA